MFKISLVYLLILVWSLLLQKMMPFFKNLVLHLKYLKTNTYIHKYISVWMVFIIHKIIDLYPDHSTG